jgi:pimeloyl-ACP methyl ester carboxylesterase
MLVPFLFPDRSRRNGVTVSEEKARNVGPARIDIAYERFGHPQDPPVLLLMGGGAQMISWPDGFVTALAARGLQPIRFDNRDVGLSTHLTGAPPPDLKAALAGDLSSASYTLSDMAADTVGLMDVLGLDGAHLAGASLGGMIAQIVAIERPGRVRSLISMMSTTGDPAAGQADLAALAPLMGLPAVTREDVIEQQVAAFKVIGSPGFPFDEAAVRDRAGRAYDRAHDPAGAARQAVAAVASGDRTGRLASVRLPVLVLHGADDKMCDVSGGRATAAAIPGAELVVFEGMGHSLPRQLWSELAARIAGFILRVETTPA